MKLKLPQAVAAFRNKCQRVAKEKLIFLDGTGISEPRRFHGLAPKGKKALVSTKEARKAKHDLIFGEPFLITKPLLETFKTLKIESEKGQRIWKKRCAIFPSKQGRTTGGRDERECNR